MGMLINNSSFRSEVLELAPVTRPVVGTVKVPGSKSITNRALYVPLALSAEARAVRENHNLAAILIDFQSVRPLFDDQRSQVISWRGIFRN